MTGDAVADARVRPGTQLEGPYVELVLTDRGARVFEALTGENVRRHLAIVLDGKVYSAPVIRERIGGGRASITGSFDIEEARDLAIVLRAGALPAPVTIAEERTVGPVARPRLDPPGHPARCSSAARSSSSSWSSTTAAPACSPTSRWC